MQHLIFVTSKQQLEQQLNVTFHRGIVTHAHQIVADRETPLFFAQAHSYISHTLTASSAISQQK